MATISDALQIAIQHHQAGRLDLAEEIYRRILVVEPEHADALHLLGIIAHEMGKHEVAVEYIARAIGLKGTEAAFHSNLGSAFQRQGKLDEAVTCYRRALELKPGYASAHYNLGDALQEQGKLDEAIACYRRALELNPEYVEAHNNLGNAFKEQGKLDEALACYRRALELNPANAEAHNNLGLALQERGKLDEAVACHRRTLELKPGYAWAHNNLGNVLQEQGKRDEALACYRRAVELNPEYVEAHNNLGFALQEWGKLDEAVVCYRRALELNPDFCGTYNNLGSVCKDRGMLEEAVAYCRQALELKPDFVLADSNLVYTLMFCPGYNAQSLYEEHCRWNQRHATPLAGLIRPHGNDRSPERRLRIGYVSPDFRDHPVGRFLLPLLEAHDHRDFEIFCYSSVRVPDEITDRCRAAADVWRVAVGLSDEELATAVRQDRIDVLVDLTMHMARNRMLVFARKPAPVQVTYLAYCGTTGLDTMDYRLTDPYLDPPGAGDRFYCEQSVRLPETYWCYRPPATCPPAGPPPDLAAGRLTFACLNNFCKVTEPTLAAWSGLLRTVPDSRLLLHARPGSHRDRVWALLAAQGVSSDRLTFVDMVPTFEYLQLYQQIDVALDPFPYGGGTTTCDALWMGVPVVSLAGKTAVGRSGLSILSNVGLPELIASDVDQYVRIAAELAADRPRLAALRATLRERMQKSPLMDAPRFARNVEAAYREMWRRWCGRERPKS